MTLTPAIKGQLAKAINDTRIGYNNNFSAAATKLLTVRVFAKHMPREQAKHAARKYLASVSA